MNKLIALNADELITCPDCSDEFPLHAGITHQMLERLQNKFDEVMAGERSALVVRLTREATRAAAKTYEEQLQELKVQLQEETYASEKLKAKITENAKKATEDAKAESEQRILDMKEQLTAKDQKLKSYQTQERKLRQEKCKLEEEKEEFDILLARQLESEKTVIRTKIAKTYKKKEAELRKQITDAKKVNEELNHKLDQGSQQLQGEVLELELEELLKEAFPDDDVAAVKKGTKGADLLQTVTTRAGARCGKIIWEIKNTRKWSNAWIQKLKDDQQTAGAEISVLVSIAFPNKSQDTFIKHNGIWVVRPNTIVAVARAMRSILIAAYKQKIISIDRNVKAEAFYDYVCSRQFAQKVNDVIAAHDTMKFDLESEKKALNRLWKKRERQLERITNNIIGMAGDFQGLTQEPLPQLESIASLTIDHDK
ncbi:MAG: DUF2130 domain-containing protein [Candidatus Sedimenticola sp. (ex Thyasira tokunagai)]